MNCCYAMYMIIMLLVLYSNKFYTVFNYIRTRSAARYWNNAKHFLVAFSRNWNKFYEKSFKKPYLYDVRTEGGGVGFLQILLFVNKKSIVHFCGWGTRGHKDGGHFSGRHDCMAPNHKQCMINPYKR